MFQFQNKMFSEGYRLEWTQGSHEKLQKPEMSFLGAISQIVLSSSKKSVVRKEALAARVVSTNHRTLSNCVETIPARHAHAHDGYAGTGR